MPPVNRRKPILSLFEVVVQTGIGKMTLMIFIREDETHHAEGREGEHGRRMYEITHSIHEECIGKQGR